MNNPIQPIDTEELSKKEKRKAWHRAYKEANKDIFRKYARGYQGARYKTTCKDKCKARYEANKEQLKARAAIRKQNETAEQKARRERRVKLYSHTETFKTSRAKYKQKRYHDDVMFKLQHTLRCHSSRAFKRIGQSKPTDTAALLGCSWEEAKTHIESLFTEGMSWNNYGSWHIDHIVPIASATTLEEAKALNHISNLQPLWAKDNLTKGAKGKLI
jgi:hypothetical protein